MTSDQPNDSLIPGAEASDRRFFRQHPKRRFRLRPAWTAKIEEWSKSDLLPYRPAEGSMWWVLVTHLWLGHYTYAPFIAPHNWDPDPSETIAREFWERFVSPRRKC
jgi:hypothetical protein